MSINKRTIMIASLDFLDEISDNHNDFIGDFFDDVKRCIEKGVVFSLMANSIASKANSNDMYHYSIVDSMINWSNAVRDDWGHVNMLMINRLKEFGM